MSWTAKWWSRSSGSSKWMKLKCKVPAQLTLLKQLALILVIKGENQTCRKLYLFLHIFAFVKLCCKKSVVQVNFDTEADQGKTNPQKFAIWWHHNYFLWDHYLRSNLFNLTHSKICVRNRLPPSRFVLHFMISPTYTWGVFWVCFSCLLALCD